MPNIQFIKQFVPLICDKQKTMTLRGFNKQKFEVGGTLYFQNGYRVGARFGTAKIKSVEKVYFSNHPMNGVNLFSHDRAIGFPFHIFQNEWLNQCGFEYLHQALSWYENNGVPNDKLLQLIDWGDSFNGV